jgi:hypothetical protein
LSELYADAEAALNFEAPAGVPWSVLAVIYGEKLETPDPIDTVEATWTPHDYPGTFISRDVKGVNWEAHLAFVIAYDYWIVQQIYALEGGWPAAPEFPPTPPGGGGPIQAV